MSSARPGASGLSWGVLARFAEYVRGSGGQIAASAGAIVDETGMPSWPLTDDTGFSGGAGTLRFGGIVRYLAHFGALDVPVADPVLEVAGGGGELWIQRPESPLSPLLLATFSWREVEAPGARAWLGDEVELAGDAVPLFGGGYPAGLRLDSLIVVIEMSQ